MSSVAYMDLAIGLLATFTLLVALPILSHIAGGWSTVACHLPATHFQVLRRLHRYPGARALPADLPADARQPVHVSEVLLCQIGEGRYPRRRWLVHRHRHPRDGHRCARRRRLGALSLAARSAKIPARFSPSRLHGFTALPPSAGRLMVGAIFAKVISTANNYLFSPSTNLINDVYVRYVKPEASNRNILARQPRSWSSCSAAGRCTSRSAHTRCSKSRSTPTPSTRPR